MNTVMTLNNVTMPECDKQHMFLAASPCAHTTIINEPLGAKGPSLVGEEVRNKDVGKVGIW